jgi:predicted nucleic acid-binding protein
MKKYRDTPMDDADATLVLPAADLSVADILTLDRRGFSTYRPPNGRAFRLAGL